MSFRDKLETARAYIANEEPRIPAAQPTDGAEGERAFAEEVAEIRREYERWEVSDWQATFPDPSWTDVGILLAALRSVPHAQPEPNGAFRERLIRELLNFRAVMMESYCGAERDMAEEAANRLRGGAQPEQGERERELLGVIAKDHERAMIRRNNYRDCMCVYCEDFRALAPTHPVEPPA